MNMLWTRYVTFLLTICFAVTIILVPSFAFAQKEELLSYEEAIESLGSISLTNENELRLIDKSLAAIGARYFAPQYKYVADALLALSEGQYIDFDAITASLSLLQSNTKFVKDYNSNEGLTYIPLSSLIEYVQARKLENEGNLQKAYDAYKTSQVLDSLDRAMVIYPMLNSTLTEATAIPSTPAESQQTVSENVIYAVITDGLNIENNAYYLPYWNGLTSFAEANAIPDNQYSAYIPKSGEPDDLTNEIETAINDGAKILILAGYSWDDSIVKVASKHSDVCFLSYGLTAKKYPINMINLNFAEEVCGFLAGYAVVKEGYTQLGFLGGYNIPAVIRFGNGYIQGANKAAIDLNVMVQMNYWYGKSFDATDEITKKMESWYTSGTEVIFSCAGNAVRSCISAAEQTGGKVIGVDLNQANLSDTVITSACKYYDTATEYLLQQNYASLNRWPSYMAGTNVRLALEEKVVGLPTDDESWRFVNFSMRDYDQIVSEIVQGKVKVSSSTTRPKAAKVKVTYLK